MKVPSVHTNADLSVSRLFHAKSEVRGRSEREVMSCRAKEEEGGGDGGGGGGGGDWWEWV